MRKRRSMTERRTRKPRKVFVKVTGSVWCDRIGYVHDNTLNPFGYAPDAWCEPTHHRPMYVRARRDEGEF